jgi:hypothetical protein
MDELGGGVIIDYYILWIYAWKSCIVIGLQESVN